MKFFGAMLACVLVALALTGCDCPDAAATDWRPLLCCEGGMVTLRMTDERPEPAPTPDDDRGAAVGGPLETYRDARALIRKGNELADRGRAILDAAERDGKITVDVRLPALDRATERLCPDGVCPVAPKRAASTLCPDGICPLPPERLLSEPGVEPVAPTACIRGIGRPRRWLPFRRWR